MHTELSRSTRPVPPETRENPIRRPTTPRRQSPGGARRERIDAARGGRRAAGSPPAMAPPGKDDQRKHALGMPRYRSSRQATARCARPARLAEPRPSQKCGSGHGGRRSATIGGMADSDDPSRDPDVPPPPKLPEVESPPPEDVLDDVPPKEDLVKRARPADEIVEEQPSVEELLDRDR